ncbi:DNA polymerase III subunit beta [bacterium]|nr:DNA polymerase III subunit beta [bacterium]
MEIYINKYTFFEALQLVVSISPKTTSEPIINNVLIETDKDNCIIIKATNHENTFYGEFEADVKKPGKICVNTAKLFNLVRELREEKIFISSTPQNWVYLTCGNSKIKLPGLDPEHYPVIEFKNLEKEFELPSEFLKNAIDKTFFAIGENESRKNLMGLNLKFVSPNKISWTGADAFRISQFNMELNDSIDIEGNIIIPKKSLLEMKRIFEYSKEKIKVAFDDNTFQISTEHIKFKTKLIEAEYPNLDRLVHNPVSNPIVISKHALTNAIKILNTITEGELKSIVKLTFQEGRILLESQKLEFGEGNDDIPCDYCEKEMSIGLNIRFLLESLNVFDSSLNENITINITGPETPLIIECDEWDNFKTVLMPVKIQW